MSYEGPINMVRGIPYLDEGASIHYGSVVIMAHFSSPIQRLLLDICVGNSQGPCRSDGEPDPFRAVAYEFTPSVVRRYGSGARVAADGSVAGVHQTIASFEYGDRLPFSREVPKASPNRAIQINGSLQYADLDGNGITDIIDVVRRPGHGVELSTYFNNIGGLWGQGQAQHPVSSHDYSQWKIDMVDVNADARADILLRRANRRGIHIYALLGNGSGLFEPASEHTPVEGDHRDWSTLVADANGDGWTDVIAYRLQRKRMRLQVLQSAPMVEGRFLAGQYLEPITGEDLRLWRLLPAEMNGDGRLDLILYKSSPQRDEGLRLRVLFAGSGSYTPSDTVLFSGSSSIEWVGAADTDGDGRSEVFYLATRKTRENVCEMVWVGSDWEWRCRMADVFRSRYRRAAGPGDGTFPEQREYAMVSRPGRPVFADLYGDGLPRLFQLSPSEDETIEENGNNLRIPTGTQAVLVADFTGLGKDDLASFARPELLLGWPQSETPSGGGPGGRRPRPIRRPGLLRRVQNQLGGSIEVHYRSSRSWNSPQNAIPNFPTVASLEVHTPPTSMNIRFQYSGARYDPQERRFLSFAQVTKEYGDLQEVVHQYTSKEMAGLIYRTDLFDTINYQLLRRTQFEWTTIPSSVPYRPLLTRRTETTFSGTQSATSAISLCKRRGWILNDCVEPAYDVYGNVLEL